MNVIEKWTFHKCHYWKGTIAVAGKNIWQKNTFPNKEERKCIAKEIGDSDNIDKTFFAAEDREVVAEVWLFFFTIQKNVKGIISLLLFGLQLIYFLRPGLTDSAVVMARKIGIGMCYRK